MPGVRLGCGHRHRPDDALLGQPLCRGCFTYAGAVLWNASVGELWRRTTIAIQRQLARLAGLPVRQLAGVVRVAFTRVAEYQERGLVTADEIGTRRQRPPSSGCVPGRTPSASAEAMPAHLRALVLVAF